MVVLVRELVKQENFSFFTARMLSDDGFDVVDQLGQEMQMFWCTAHEHARKWHGADGHWGTGGFCQPFGDPTSALAE